MRRHDFIIAIAGVSGWPLAVRAQRDRKVHRIGFLANDPIIQRFPAIYPFTEVAEAGGLMSYGASRPDLFRQAATYAAKILEGANPAYLPIEQPTKFELAVNVTTAKTLHLKIPGTLLALADKVIE